MIRFRAPSPEQGRQFLNTVLAVEVSSSQLLPRKIIGFVPVPQGLAIVLQDTAIQDGFRSMSTSHVERGFLELSVLLGHLRLFQVRELLTQAL